MKYQLVIQLPALSIADYDRMIELEDAITERLGDVGEVDGHDSGSGESNIFVHTDQPDLSFKRIRKLLGSEDLIRDSKVAYRAFGSDNLIVLHPADLRHFAIA